MRNEQISSCSSALKAALLVFVGVGSVVAQVSITTYHNDNARTAQNLSETLLKPANVNANTFGKLFVQPLDGRVYAQPLYVPSVTIPGKGAHNVIYVATEHDSVYAYDADNPLGANSAPLWQTTFLSPGNSNVTTVPATELGCPDLVPELGITGTPVIDPSSNTMYLVARTQESGVDVDKLHALDITTGLEKFGSPILIQPTVPGTGEGGTMITFNSVTQNQRAALALQDGKVYVGFGSLCDTNPYHGWLLAYNAQTLNLIAAWISTPNELEGGIWGGGAAPAIDSSSNLFFATSNGTFDINLGGSDITDSVIKLPEPVSSSWSTLDYFAPYDQPKMAKYNLDLGSGGVMLLPDQPMGSPHQHLLVACGKEGTIYLVDRDSMGNFNAVNNSQIVQVLVGANLGIMGSPAWWNNNLYYSGRNDVVKQYSLDSVSGLLSTAPVSTSPASHQYILGTSPSISANGNTNAIVWTAENYNGTAIMHAYDATNLGIELYNTTMKINRDGAGAGVRFMEPTIANGKVYLATNKHLYVYGILGVAHAPTVLSVSPSSGSINGGASVTITGTNFASGATVTFGETAATNVVFGSSTSLTATTPAHATGAVNIVVTNPNQQSGSLTKGFTYTSGVSTIKFVQVAAATPQSPLSTVAIPYTQSQTLGNMNLVVVGWNDSTSTVQSVSDTLGNTYTLAVGLTTGTGLRQSIYYAKNIKAGTNTVNVTFNQAAVFADIRVLEYSGLDTTSPLDASAGSVGNTATASTSSVTTKFAIELIYGADTVSTGNKTAGSGFTTRIITSPDSDLAEDHIVTTTGSYNASATLTASGNWVMQLATFKAAGQ